MFASFCLKTEDKRLPFTYLTVSTLDIFFWHFLPFQFPLPTPAAARAGSYGILALLSLRSYPWSHFHLVGERFLPIDVSHPVLIHTPFACVYASAWDDNYFLHDHDKTDASCAPECFIAKFKLNLSPSVFIFLGRKIYNRRKGENCFHLSIEILSVHFCGRDG